MSSPTLSAVRLSNTSWATHTNRVDASFDSGASDAARADESARQTRRKRPRFFDLMNQPPVQQTEAQLSSEAATPDGGACVPIVCVPPVRGVESGGATGTFRRNRKGPARSTVGVAPRREWNAVSEFSQMWKLFSSASLPTGRDPRPRIDSRERVMHRRHWDFCIVTRR